MDTVEERIKEEQKSEQLKKEQNGIEMTIEADDVITYATMNVVHALGIR